MANPFGGIVPVAVTIASGASLSSAVNIAGGVVVAIQMPATWTAADLTFQASYDGVTYANMYDALDDELLVEVDSARFVVIDPSVWVGVHKLKVRSGTAGSPVNQGGDRVLVLVTKGLDG